MLYPCLGIRVAWSIAVPCSARRGSLKQPMRVQPALPARAAPASEAATSSGVRVKRQRFGMEEWERDHHCRDGELKANGRERRPPFARRNGINTRLDKAVLKHGSTLTPSDLRYSPSEECGCTTLDTCGAFMFP